MKNMGKLHENHYKMQQKLRGVQYAVAVENQAERKPDRDAIVQALYSACGNDAAWTVTLSLMANFFGANISLLVVAGQGQRDKSFYAAFNHREDMARAYSDYWWEHDVMLQAVLKARLFTRGMVGRGSDIISNDDLRASRYYREYMVNMPAEHFLGCILSDGLDTTLSPPMHLSFFRPPGAPDFSDANVEALIDLYPHIHRAFELHWQQRAVQEQLGVFHQSLDGLDFGVIFIDSANRVRHANAAAKQMVASTAFAYLLGGLPSKVPLTGALANLVQKCAMGQGDALSMGSGHERLFALALPLAISGAVAADAGARASVMLMLLDPLKRSEVAMDFVARAFSLSKAESRLLPLLMESCTPADIAHRLDLKIATVRSQLSAIFAKTGTRRQQELIQLLGKLPKIQRFSN